MGARVGFKCKLYIAPAPWISDPAWNPVNRVKDAEVSMEDGEADASDRGTGNYEATLSTLRKLEYSLKITHDPNDTRYQEIRDAFVNRTDLNVLGLSGDILDSGSEGPRALCRVAKFARSEGLTETVMMDVLLKPTYDSDPTHQPGWVQIP